MLSSPLSLPAVGPQALGTKIQVDEDTDPLSEKKRVSMSTITGA